MASGSWCTPTLAAQLDSLLGVDPVRAPDFAELEINPLVATATGIRALDVRGRVTASKEDA